MQDEGYKFFISRIVILQLNKKSQYNSVFGTHNDLECCNLQAEGLKCEYCAYFFKYQQKLIRVKYDP